MTQKAFNELLLWKGQIQKNQKESKLNQPSMILPKINALTGKYTPESPSIHEELNYRYSVYSLAYWRGVKIRQIDYRIKNKLY